MFKKISTLELNENVFKLISKDWILLASGNVNDHNMMTASWGSMGHLWNKDICIAFVRPQRYTFKYMEKYDFFTFNFFQEKYREVLEICGKKSGRDINKAKETGISPIKSDNNSVFFEEAILAIECKKLYYQDIKENNFLDISFNNKVYPEKDYHRIYIGQITNIYKKVILN